MKRIIIGFGLLVLLFSTSGVLVAQDKVNILTPEEEAFVMANTYLDARLSVSIPDSDQQLQRYRQIAQVLTLEEKDLLYKKYSYPVASAITLNLVTGGLGSILYDRSKWVGVILQVFSTVGISAAVYSIYEQNPNTDKILMWCSYGFSGAAVLGGIVFPLIEGSIQNKPLRTIFK